MIFGEGKKHISKIFFHGCRHVPGRGVVGKMGDKSAVGPHQVDKRRMVHQIVVGPCFNLRTGVVDAEVLCGGGDFLRCPGKG